MDIVAGVIDLVEIAPGEDRSRHTQVEAGRLKAIQHQILFDDLVVTRFVDSHSVVCDYQPPPDTTLFFFHSPQSPLIRWCGVDIERDVILVRHGDWLQRKDQNIFYKFYEDFHNKFENPVISEPAKSVKNAVVVKPGSVSRKTGFLSFF